MNEQFATHIYPFINFELIYLSSIFFSQGDQLQLNNTDLCITSVDNELVHLLPCQKQYSKTAIQLSKGDNLKNNNNSNGQDYKGDNFVSSSSFQHWTFDYSFNWKRRRRNG